jgi:hypothetical protein
MAAKQIKFLGGVSLRFFSSRHVCDSKDHGCVNGYEDHSCVNGHEDHGCVNGLQDYGRLMILSNNHIHTLQDAG